MGSAVKPEVELTFSQSKDGGEIITNDDRQEKKHGEEELKGERYDE